MTRHMLLPIWGNLVKDLMTLRHKLGMTGFASAVKALRDDAWEMLDASLEV